MQMNGRKVSVLLLIIFPTVCEKRKGILTALLSEKMWCILCSCGVGGITS